MGSLIAVTLASVTGLPKDNFVNTWSVDDHGIAPPAADRASILSAIADFYINNGGLFSGAVSRAANAHTLKLYDITGKLDGSAHGSPVQVGAFGLAAPTAGVDYPSEVAVAITLEGTLRAVAPVEVAPVAPAVKSTRPKQRHTGRIYLGPLRSALGDGGTPVRPNAATMTALRTSVDTMADTIRAIGGGGKYQLGVWSRKDALIYPLAGVSTDNAFDTQRRRGEAATARVRTTVDVALAA